MRLVALHGQTSSLVLEVRGSGAPLLRWWGPRVGAGPTPSLLDGRFPASFSLDEDPPLDLVPTLGAGRFGAPALEASRDGAPLAVRWNVAAVAERPNAVSVTLEASAAGVRVEQRIALDPAGDVVTLAATLTNTGATPLEPAFLAAGTLPLPADAATIRSFTGRHNAEFVAEVEPMPAHSWLRENRRGLTGHAGPPGLFVEDAGAGWHSGVVRAGHLAWSGNHRLVVARDDEGFWTLQAGEALAPGEVVLAPGDSYSTPDLLAVASDAGRNGAIQAFHDAVRSRAPWPAGGMRPRPVHVNSWEGFYFDHDEAVLMALAERAAALGVERFVLDDGWFKGRDDDTAALGDWTPDPRKYPVGLGPLARHVVGLGMEFGLWVEPEMVNPDSDLYRSHPDWALAPPGVPARTARHQLVLDLAREDVRDHLFGVLDRLVRELPIACLKWDHNRGLSPGGGHAQTAGAYALIDRLRRAHPALEIEACAGGGGRTDAGMAARAHRFWTSDCIDAVSRVAMQRGFLHFLPPEMMGAHVGASPAHSTGRAQSMAFRAAVALPGHFGVELDPATMGSGDAELLADGIARYKQMRDRLHAGRVWLGEGADGLMWQLHGEPGDLILIVTRVRPVMLRRPPPLPLPPLAGAGPTNVRLLHLATAPGHPAPDAPLFAAMRESGVVLDGDWLARAGLPLPAMKAESVALFALRRSP